MEILNLPKKIRVIEVCPRDGFQNVKKYIDVGTKLQIINGLIRAGLQELEITSFVHSKAIPQMKDAGEIALDLTEKHPDIRMFALVPNLRGAQNAVAAGLNEVTYVISASEAHNRANVNRTIQESLQALQELRETFPELKIRLDVATAFGCPFDGNVSEEKVLSLIENATKVGLSEIVLCDTIGVANPLQVSRLARLAKDADYKLPIAMHLHNTRGMGLANTLAAMQQGVNAFETAAGGLGGCPFAPGASGNTATEDTVNFLEAMGIMSGVNLELLLDTVGLIVNNVEAKMTGNMLNACRRIERNKE